MAQKKATSTTALVNVAANVFLEKGFATSTIDDVAQAAGISKPTVYQYVSSKKWLLEEVVRVMCAKMEQLQVELYAEPVPPIVRLHWSLELHVELAIVYRNSYRLTLSEQTALSPAAREEFRLWARRTTALFAELLTECQQEGSFTWDGDAMVAANLILSMLTGTHRWSHPHDGETVAEYSRTLAEQIRVLLAGVIAETDMSDWPRSVVSHASSQPANAHSVGA